MTTVTGKLIGSAAPQRVEMTATLVDVTGKTAVGYVSSVPGELVQPKKITPGSDGAWSVDLTPNSGITSDAGDTLWAITEGRALDGTPIRTYVVVPDSGSHWVGSIRADLSDTQTGDGTVVYLAGQPGPAGATGATGPAGADGTDGQDGAAGASAYQVAVAGGFVGTEAQWLSSLVGPQGETGPQGPQPALGAAGDGADIALRSTDASTTNSRTPTAHKTSHATGGSDPLTPADIGADPAGTAAAAVSPLDTRLDTVEAVLPDKADKSGATFTGAVTVNGADLSVLGAGKGYRFRRGGGALDLEATGADLILSNWSGTAFDGTQRAYDRYSADALNVQHAGKREYVSALYGAVVHSIDPATGVAALGGKNGLTAIRFAGLKATPGAPTTGAWAAGDTVTDSNGVWWLCTASGTPGTWVTGALPASGGTLTGNLAVTGHALGQDTPAAHGLIAWPYPAAQAVNTTEVANGVLYLTRVNVDADGTATKLHWWVGNSGSSPVSGQNHAGLYASDGTLLASVNVGADISSAGMKTTTIAAQSLTAGQFYWVGLLFNAAVPPSLTRGSGWTGVDAAANVGQTPATYTYAKNGTGRTALPSSITPASNVGTDFAGPWVAVGP